MKFAAMVLAVCHKQKLEWLPHVLSSINDSPNFQFDRKVLAVDEFNGWKFPSSLLVQFRGSKWMVIKDSHRSRPKSMLHALKNMSEDICFYHEDDVIVNAPPRDRVEQLFDMKSPDGRLCGMVSLTLGGTQAWFCGYEGIGDLAKAEENTLLKWDDAFAFKREERGCDLHYFEFPGLFIRRDLLNLVLTHSMMHCKGMQIEKGLTRAWFDLGLEQRFFKCSIAKNSLIPALAADYKSVFRDCRLLSNLDPFQGSSPYAGSHAI